MLNEEKEINDKSEDSLNRSNFAESLALNIQNYFNRKPVNDCLTIGLMGEWGSGKTSTLNLTKNCLKKSDIKIIEFNPWIYSSYNQLVEQFFNVLIREFSNDDDTLKKYFNEYKLKLNKMDLVKNIAISGISYLNSNVGNFTKRILKLDTEEKNLEKIKANINKQLKKHNVLFIIDDLDRLPKDEIAEMFKLIKIMADFKNIIYLVSFDKNVVSESLKEKYGGERYIEKIINVPLHIPSIDYSELKDCLIGHFKRISKEYDKYFDPNRMNQFLDFKPEDYNKPCGILYFFRNMRDVIRFINILEFNIELIKDEVDLVDFIVLTSLQVFHLNIYDEIKFNEFLLTDYHYTIVIEEIDNKIIKDERKEFENIVNENMNLNHILRRLFPKMNGLYIEFPPLYLKNERACDKNLLICHPNHFKAYFKLNSVIKDMSESEIDFIVNYINSEDTTSLCGEFSRLYDKNRLRLFFENIKNRVYKINKNIFFLEFLLNFETHVGNNIFFDNRDCIMEVCLELIYDINEQERFEILIENYQNSNNVILLYELLDYIKMENNNHNNNGSFLNEDEIEKLQKIIKEKFNEISNDSFMVHNKLNEILYIGSKLDLENKNEMIINDLLLNSLGILILLNSFLPDGENTHHLLRKMETLNSYKDIDEIKELIDENKSIKDEQVVKNFLEGYEQIKISNHQNNIKNKN